MIRAGDPLRPEDVDAIDVQVFGWSLLQPFRYATSDNLHARVILDVLDPPTGASILDVGCGTGALAELMVEERPDLDFTLANFSQVQLDLCPFWAKRHLCDAHALPFADQSFDVVMFNFALGNMDPAIALAEAARVLRIGGVLLINEARVAQHSDGDALAARLKYQPLVLPEIYGALRTFGFRDGLTCRPPVAEHTLSDLGYASEMVGVTPVILRATKTHHTLSSRLGRLFARHGKVALALSGGRDSLACLHLVRPFWDRVTVYWTNPGNPLPETVAFMAEIRALVPHFVEVAGRQREVIAEDGWPSDVVPQRYTTDGNLVFGATDFKVQSRLSCCFRSLMWPMYAAMVAAGETCCIRGKRRDEADKTGVESGYVSDDGIELVFPIMEWSADEVSQYLGKLGVELPAYYRHARHSLDCLDCTAWWGEGLSHYLKAEHPVAFVEYKDRILKIKEAISEQMAECEV